MDSNSRIFCHLFLIISILFVVYFLGVDSGETCRKKDPFGNDEVFECPRLFESRKKRFCCGITLQDKHCCEWSKKSQDFIRNPDARTLFEGAAAIIILILLIVGGLIVCCCVCACCLLSRKRQQRGHVIGHSPGEGTIGGTSVTTVNSYPNSGSYPIQATAYQMQNVAPYPMADNPPPYHYSQTQPPFNPSYPIK